MSPTRPAPDPSGAVEAPGAWPEQWMRDLERAHDRLCSAALLVEENVEPVLDLRPAAGHVDEAFAALFDAFDHRDQRLAATQRARDALKNASAELTPAASDPAASLALEQLRDATAAVEAAIERLAPLVQRPPPEAPDLRASKDLPALHALGRPSLVAPLRVRDPRPVVAPAAPVATLHPRTFEELDAAIEAMKARALERQAKGRRELPAAKSPATNGDGAVIAAEPPPGFVRVLPPPVPARTYLLRRARECFEDVAMIGVQRAPLLGDPWRSALFLETRMIRAIDAVVAMGTPALGALDGWVRDAPAKDPSRLFAMTMILGCVDGRDALSAAERIFLATGRVDPEVGRHFGAALKLVPHPLLPLTLRTLLGGDDPEHRALAIDVLAYRGMATRDELAKAAVDAPEVAAAALPYFALTQSALTQHALTDAVESAVASGDVKVLPAAWLAMALSGHPRAPRTIADALEARAASPDLLEGLAMLLALSGDDRNAAWLLARAQAAPARPLVTAVGWAGSAAAIEPLMALLEHDDDAVKLAAAYALDRITGAGLYETVDVDPEDIVVDEIPEADVGLDDDAPPPARVVSDPRDLPGRGAPDSLARPTTRVASWRAWWKEKKDAFDPKARYRRGHPYTAMVSLAELDRYPATPGERRHLMRELVIRTGGYVRMDPHDFVVVQEEALEEWAEIAPKGSSRPGAWALPSRRG